MRAKQLSGATLFVLSCYGFIIPERAKNFPIKKLSTIQGRKVIQHLTQTTDHSGFKTITDLLATRVKFLGICEWLAAGVSIAVGFRCSKQNQSGPCGAHNGLGTALCPQLSENGIDMKFDGVLTDIEMASNELVGKPLRHAL